MRSNDILYHHFFIIKESVNSYLILKWDLVAMAEESGFTFPPSAVTTID